MTYTSILRGIFLDRPNRFIAHVDLGNGPVTVHVKNTGRCRELLIPGARVVLTPGNNPARKTPYDLVAVYKEKVGWVNIDSQLPNHVVHEWLRAENRIFPEKTLIRPETVYGHSRVDFYLECGKRRILLEVKGCTLERNGSGFFPDAPTERGVKHLKELAASVSEGYEAWLAFVIAIPGVEQVYPNGETDPAFESALNEARQAGVRILYLPCEVTPEKLSIEEHRISIG